MRGLIGLIIGLVILGYALAEVDFRPILELTEWRDLSVADEDRCGPYLRKDYPYYRKNHEGDLLEIWGPVSPYISESLPEDLEGVQVDHLVALAEAHDSGLCAVPQERKREFANDIDNLVFAPADLNREKSAHDASDWIPEVNQCWFAEQVILIRKKYELTIDLCEVLALERILMGCD